jgi:hypothetical protein
MGVEWDLDTRCALRALACVAFDLKRCYWHCRCSTLDTQAIVERSQLHSIPYKCVAVFVCYHVAPDWR